MNPTARSVVRFLTRWHKPEAHLRFFVMRLKPLPHSRKVMQSDAYSGRQLVCFVAETTATEITSKATRLVTNILAKYMGHEMCGYQASFTEELGSALVDLYYIC